METEPRLRGENVSVTDRWHSCWEAGYDIHSLLKESNTLEIAREKIIQYIEDLDWSYRKDALKIESWDYIVLKEAVRTLKNIISPRNERLSGSSPLEYLWKAAREGDSEVEKDFIEEFTHLFKAIKGRAEIYPSSLLNGMEYPDFDKYRGREAGNVRSDFLDVVGEEIDKYIQHYPDGIQPDVNETRIVNKNRILEYFSADQDDWNDWKWHFKHDAIRRQVFPPKSYVENMITHKEDRKEAFDFMREGDTSPIDLVTRRYPKVAIIKPYESCPQICVYCQRNWEITEPLEDSAEVPRKRLDSALDWFADHPHMKDALVTGGDPLVLKNEKIEYIVKRLSEIPHIKNIRIATRMPITVPQRLTQELCEMFGSYFTPGKQTICMVTHFSHPYEVTLDTANAISCLRKQGLPVYNQQVFSFANSRRFETVALRMSIKQIGVDPYYTFNMKGKSEIEDYAVPVARILQERKEEARLLPGIFRSDEPVFNVPKLGKNHLRSWQDHELISILPDGRRIYSFHPWEKNLNRVKPYLYTDVPIKSYLERLKERGEDVRDYRSIWYYY
jgi:lysine 2,3-aminomutase